MSMIVIKLEGMDKALAALNPKVSVKALNRTINEIGTKAKNQMIRDIRNTYNIKAKDLKQFVKVRRSKYSNLAYVISSRGRPLNATRFGARALKKKGFISVKIRKDRGRKKIARAFFSNKPGNAVLQRIKGTQKIRGVKTVSIPQMFNEKIVGRAKKMIGDEFENKFKHNFDFYISKM